MNIVPVYISSTRSIKESETDPETIGLVDLNIETEGMLMYWFLFVKRTPV